MGETLAQFDGGWLVTGLSDDSFITVTHESYGDPIPNLTWDLSSINSDVERATVFADILSRLIDATIVDTERINGFVADITGHDDLGLGNVRGLYIYKGSDTDDIFIGNGEYVETVVGVMKNYVPGEPMDTDKNDETPTEPRN